MDARRELSLVTVLLALGCYFGQPSERGRAEKAQPLKNLASDAQITASSEYNGHYRARFVADGKLPQDGGRKDVDQAWCVQGNRERHHAWIRFQWERPVSIAELVYYGRTSWYDTECWKDYEIYGDDDSRPIARGSLEKTAAPQRIPLTPTTTRTLTIRWLQSYGGPNPGANEILVLGSPSSKEQLAATTRQMWLNAGVSPPPTLDRIDADALASLIERMSESHGGAYAAYGEHSERLQALRSAMVQASAEQREALDEKLAALQRDVLLWDVHELVVIKRHEITASHVYTYHYEGFRAGGGLYVVSVEDPDHPRLLVESPEGQILDCDLSWDGSQIVFSWRRREDEGYHLWRINVDGTGLTQITDGPWHDYNACWLPDGDIAFLTTRSPQFAYCWHAPVGILHRMHSDGTALQKLSANYLNDFTPQVLADGRLIYTRWEYVDRPAIPIQSLWTMNPDGTDLAGYFGNRVISPGTFMEARPIPGTSKIVCTMTGHNGPTRGAIGVIDRSHGVNAQEAITNITPDVPVPAVDQGNGNTSGSKLYSGPFPLDQHRLLLSARGPLLVRTFSGECQSTVLPAPNGGMQWFAAQPLRARPRPPVVASKLPEGAPPYATVLLQDIYDGLEPYVKRGEVVALRVVRDVQKTVRIDPKLRAFGFQFPVISCGATYAAKEVLGEVPVEADGSAYFRVPAETNLSFMAIDARGRAVQRMRSFTHLMPGERQSCVGCHEHRLKAPPPRNVVAMKAGPRDLSPPVWGAGPFDYSTIVQPVWDRYCISCHNPVDAPQGIDLTGGKTDFFNVSYDVLARENQGRKGSPYVSWIPTYNGQEWNILEITPKAWGSPQSRLAEVVLSGHPDGDGTRRVEMDDGSLRRVLAWIDLNVPYYGTSETAYPDEIGCRRLYPEKLDEVLAEVAGRRCAQCHEGGKIPRREWTRITEPEFNPFLMAPLARQAGGSQRCGTAVFQDRSDPDYQAILATFDGLSELLKQRPRMDMPGGQPAEDVCRLSQ